MAHGKTVLLKTICGYMFLSSGDVFQDGVKIRNKNNYIQDAGILIENPQFLSHLTLIENLKLLKEMSSKITDEEIETIKNKYLYSCRNNYLFFPFIYVK